MIDIREQYPLPLNATRAIAQERNIAHPVHPRGKHEIVMTTDFLLTVQCDDHTLYHARTFKYAEEINVQSNRVFEKLEIERLYWKPKGSTGLSLPNANYPWHW